MNSDMQYNVAGCKTSPHNPRGIRSPIFSIIGKLSGAHTAQRTLPPGYNHSKNRITPARNEMPKIESVESKKSIQCKIHATKNRRAICARGKFDTAAKMGRTKSAITTPSLPRVRADSRLL